jgi:hypothetical protein
LDIKELTPQEINVGVGDCIDLERDIEKDLMNQASTGLCLLGSWITWENMKAELPKTEEELLDYAGATESEAKMLGEMESKKKDKWLAAMSRRILISARASTFKAVEEILKELEITEETLREAKLLFDESVQKIKEQLEGLIFKFREPDEAEVTFMIPKPGEDGKLIVERCKQIMFDCLIGSNIGDGNGGIATVEQVKKMLHKKGMLCHEVAMRFQKATPLANQRGRNLAK